MASQIGQFKIPITLQENWRTYEDDFNLAIAKIKLVAKKHGGNGEYVAEVLKFSVRDGYAYYVVMQEEPLQLAHIAVGDNYTLPNAEVLKLTMVDITKMVEVVRDRDRKLYNYHTKYMPRNRTAHFTRDW